MNACIRCAKAGVTTGEWGQTLREVFGEYRAPTGVVLRSADMPDIASLRQAVGRLSGKLGTPLRLIIGKPGLDGHSNGAEQIALRAAQCGIEVGYDGIRSTPDQIVASVIESKPHIIGLSILSGSHVPLVREVMNRLRDSGLGTVPVVVGGIIPAEDVNILRQLGVRRVYTPKDFELNRIVGEIVEIVAAQLDENAA